MTEWKSTNLTSSSSQSSIAAMKKFLAEGRLTPLSSPPTPSGAPSDHTYSPPPAGDGVVGGCAKAIPVRPTLLPW